MKKTVLRAVALLSCLAMAPLLSACVTGDPAAFLNKAAELRGELSDQTLGRVGPAIDNYCALVPIESRLRMRDTLAGHTAGHRLEIHCAGDPPPIGGAAGLARDPDDTRTAGTFEEPG